jgi:predicted Zn-ribbon and HTH transcriptional regulator
MATKRTLKAEEIVGDVRAGMVDSGLMKKHRLSAWGLQDLLEQLVRAGLLSQSELDQRMVSVDSTVEVRDVLENAVIERSPRSSETGLHRPWKCPGCGFLQPKEPERCPNCGTGDFKENGFQAEPPRKAAPPSETSSPSGEDTPQVGKPAKKKRIVLAEDVIRDFKAGLTDAEMMAKYRLSARGLQSLTKKLLAAKYVTKADLKRRPPLHVDTVAISREMLPAAPSDPVTGAPDPPDSDPITGRLDRFREQAGKVGKVRAAIDARLTVEEICELWDQETKDTLALVTEAWNRFDEMRRALSALRVPPH